MICHTLPSQIEESWFQVLSINRLQGHPTLHAQTPLLSHIVTHLYLLEVNRFLDDLVILW